MMKTLFAGACLVLSFNAFSFDCTAIDRYVEKNENHESKAALVFTLDNAHTIKMEVEHRGQLYFVTYNKEDDDALLQIVNSADDTKGIVVRASFNKYGIMNVSRVDGQTVHRMECFK